MNPSADRRGFSMRLWSRFPTLRGLPRNCGFAADFSRSRARQSQLGRARLGRAWLGCWLAVLPLLPLAACGAAPAANETVNAGQFQDVVVPTGLRLVDDAHESHSVQAASWRLGHFLYTGAVRVEDAANYVRQRMPQHNWELVADEVVDPVTTRLCFVRGLYSAEYRFVRHDGRIQMVVDYKTDYTPR